MTMSTINSASSVLDMDRPVQVEIFLLLSAIALSPLWFLHPEGLNITLTDGLLVIAACLYAIRTSRYVLAPTRKVLAAELVFLIAATVSLALSPIPESSFVDYAQYILLFFVVVPMGILIGKNRRTRYQAIVLVTFITLAVTVATLAAGLTAAPRQQLQLWYSNPNQLAWIISAGGVLSAGFAATSSLSKRQRLLAAFGTVLATGLLASNYLGRVALTSLIMLAGGFWLLGYDWTRRHGHASWYGVGTLFIAVVGITGVVANWQTVWIEGSMPSRIIQYSAALDLTVSYPFGVGFGASTVLLDVPHYIAVTVHNSLLSYLISTGIFGLLAILAVYFYWVREVGVWSLGRDLPQYEVAAVAVFAMVLVISLFQPAPVRRLWWLLFGVTWGIRLDYSR